MREISWICLAVLAIGCAGKKAGGGGGSALGSGSSMAQVVGKVESVLGAAWLYSDASRKWVPLAAGDALPKGGLLKTAPGANLEFSLRDGSHVELMSDSSLVIQGELTEGNGLSLYLGGGRVRGLYSGAQLELLTACGSSIELAPKAGASVPFDVSNRPPIHGGLSMGMGSDEVWSTASLPSELPLVIRSSVSPDVFFTNVPEPGTGLLLIAGVTFCAGASASWRRRRS